MTSNITVAAATAKVAELEAHFAAGGSADLIGRTVKDYIEAKATLEVAQLRQGD